MTDPKLVQFPKPARNMERVKGDAELVADVHRAQRKYVKALRAAQAVGLHIRFGHDVADPVTVSRVFKGKR